MVKRIIGFLNRWKYKRAVAARSIEARFSNIYKSNLWFENKESRSGAGSTLKATSNLRTELPRLLEELDAKVLADIGCGDFYWMKEIKLPCKYIGLDIVSSVIQENVSKYGSDERRFIHSNAVEDKVPAEADIVLCREVLFHLSFEDGLKLISNINASNARYFITTTDSSVVDNKDIKTGYFRNINLEQPPYSFPKLKSSLMDNAVSASRMLGVWSVEEIRSKFSNR